MSFECFERLCQLLLLAGDDGGGFMARVVVVLDTYNKLSFIVSVRNFVSRPVDLRLQGCEFLPQPVALAFVFIQK